MGFEHGHEHEHDHDDEHDHGHDSCLFFRICALTSRVSQRLGARSDRLGFIHGIPTRLCCGQARHWQSLAPPPRHIRRRRLAHELPHGIAPPRFRCFRGAIHAFVACVQASQKLISLCEQGAISVVRNHEEMELSTNVHTFTQEEFIHGIGPPV